MIAVGIITDRTHLARAAPSGSTSWLADSPHFSSELCHETEGDRRGSLEATRRDTIPAPIWTLDVLAFWTFAWCLRALVARNSD